MVVPRIASIAEIARRAGQSVVLLRVKDADGEKYKMVADSYFRKAKRNETAESSFKLAPGESYSVRCFMEIPKDAKPKTLRFGQNDAHAYSLDVSAVK